uniref:Glyoxylate reductase/hydroxypyruvate reductase n=1 Tax=Graphocephala atropunctata TaxID=36148 RepID=A0A1B6M7W9_9HEMI
MNEKKRFKILIAHNEIPQSGLNVFAEKLERYELVISKTEGSPFPSRETLLNDIKGVDAVMWFGHVHVDREMLEAAGSQLQVVGSMGAGYDHIDVKLLRDRNIPVSNTPNILSCAVADMAVGLALAVSRNILQGHNTILADKWVANHPTWMCGPALEGSTVGIVGLGAIGSKIAKRIRTFDIGRLLYTNRRQRPEAVELGATYVSLDKLLAESDFVFLTVPLTPDTRGLLGLEQFRKMKPTSILTNVARGDVINQDDLVRALQTKMIGGAGLDVMSPEPLPPDHPLTKLPNVVLTPHISSATFRARETMAKLAAENICNILNNKELLTPIP